MKQRKRKTCGQYIADRAAANRDKQVEQIFSDLERQALIDRLNTDAPTREKHEQENRNH